MLSVCEAHAECIKSIYPSGTKWSNASEVGRGRKKEESRVIKPKPIKPKKIKTQKRKTLRRRNLLRYK